MTKAEPDWQAAHQLLAGLHGGAPGVIPSFRVGALVRVRDLNEWIEKQVTVESVSANLSY